ncbi:C6 zinc finger protein [Tricladium varicosporioides]|nr:C6 zinc finger protein [Hymenoscyphus varicosporioides]
MTYTGKPSWGCETCRKVHTKCDEKRPECSRCVRLKKVCHGYREEVDFMFRTETGDQDSRSTQIGKRQTSKSRTSRGAYSHELLIQHGKNCRYLLPSVAKSLFPSHYDKELCYFYESMLETVAESDHSRYLHLQLPTLFSRTRHNSALYFAAQAISHAVWAKSRGNHARTMGISRKHYVQSISALKVAIQDPVEAKSDENLYAVLLLCGYETIMFDSEALPAWGSHVDGATALLRARGKGQLSTPLQCYMFLFIRRNAVHSHVQLSRPVDPIFNELSGAVLSFENAEDRLISRTIKVPQLQSLANDILSQPHCNIMESVVWELIQAAEELDRELVDWASNVPAEWSYSVAQDLNSVFGPETSNPCYIPTEIRGYPDFYVARVWNLYHVSRLILQSIILRTTSWVYPPPKITNIEKASGMLVNGICASVPFLLGYDLLQLKKSITNIDTQGTKSIWPQSSTTKARKSKHTGRFSLIWPLYISCSVLSIPEAQRQWMRAQLQWIAECGESQAKIVAGTQSQTLLGQPEDFRFDCV